MCLTGKASHRQPKKCMHDAGRAADGAAAADFDGTGKEQHTAAGKRPREDADEGDAGPSHRSRQDDAGEAPVNRNKDKERINKQTEGASGSQGHRKGDGGAEEDDEAGWDVTANMNPRQKKLYLLQRKSAKARKANEHAAVAEAKRVRAGPPDTHLERKKWLDRQRKEKQVRVFCSRQCSLRINSSILVQISSCVPTASRFFTEAV